MALPITPELLYPIPVIFVAVALFIKSRSTSKNPLLPMEWPVLGILPSLVVNLHRLHNYITTILLASSGHSFKASVAGTQFFATCDPANVHHIFTSNHANYPKGEGFGETFDVVAGSLFTADGESCRRQRARYRSILGSPQLVASVARCCRDKVERGLLPFLTSMARTGTPVDMKDLMTRFVFDLYAFAVFGVDPGCLSLDMPPVHVADAMDTVMEAGFLRLSVPAFCWKVMRCLKIGPERKLAAAQAILRRFTTAMILERRKASHIVCQEEEEATTASSVDVMSNYVHDPDYTDDLLRATLISYMIAGRDTIGTALPWLFYCLAKNPIVVSSIRDELAPIVSRKAATASSAMIFEPEEVRALVYLQATLLESLRLYPPIPIERKAVVAYDVMPSGHEVCARDTIIVSLYSMARMEDVWGADCREYKPERWLSEDGRQLRYVPSHKFLAFNSGARMCLGKDIAIMQMKTIMAAVVWNFDVEMSDVKAVEPKLSCLLQMKNGLKMKVHGREM